MADSASLPPTAPASAVPAQSPAPPTPTPDEAAPASPPAGTSPPPTSPASAATPAATTGPGGLAPVEPDALVALLGTKVRGPDGKDIYGAIVNVLADDTGHPRAVVVDFGGFLGVGARKIAVDWNLLQFRPKDHDAPIRLDLDREQIQEVPEYKDPTQPAKILEPPAAQAAAPSDAGRQAN